MKNLIFTLLLFVSTTGMGHSQTYMKGNCAYWLLMMPNISAETKISKHFTLSGEIFYSPWENVKT